MKKRKIAFFIESFIVGGAERVLIDIVNHLDPKKFDITVVSIYKYSVYKNYNKNFIHPFSDKVKYRYLVNNHNRLFYLIFNYLLNKIPGILFKCFVSSKYDTIVAFYEGLPTSWIGRLRDTSMRKVAWLHTTTDLSQKNSDAQTIAFQRQLYGNFNEIIAVSKSAARSFSKLFGLTAKVIYNPIDIRNIQERISEAPLNASDSSLKVFVSVGRITPCKGYDRVIEIAAALKKKGYNFVWQIIGGGDAVELLENIKGASLTDCVQLLGHQNNPYNYIKHADLFLSTSYTEGLGMSLIEALSLGKPVISSNFDAAYEILGDSEYGIICTSNAQFIITIEKYLLQPEEFSKYENLGRQRAGNFAIESQIKKIEEIL